MLKIQIPLYLHCILKKVTDIFKNFCYSSCRPACATPTSATTRTAASARRRQRRRRRRRRRAGARCSRPDCRSRRGQPGKKLIWENNNFKKNVTDLQILMEQNEFFLSSFFSSTLDPLLPRRPDVLPRPLRPLLRRRHPGRVRSRRIDLPQGLLVSVDVL